MMTTTYFKALSDSTRIRLLNILLHHELGVNDLVSFLDMSQSGISRHLRILAEADLLSCRRDGVWAFYSVAENGLGRAFIDSIRYLFEEDVLLKNDLARAEEFTEEMKKQRMHFFNTIASEWDFLKRELLGGFDLNSFILQHMEDCSVAVDLGCGTGELISVIKSRASHVIGVDSSSRMLSESRKRFRDENGRIDLRLGELEHLPMSDGEAELAVTSMTLHHLTRPEAAIAEVSRILRPGGSFLIVDFDKHSNETMRQKYGFRWLGFSPTEIEHWLRNHFFTINYLKSHELNNNLKLNLYKSIKKREEK